MITDLSLPCGALCPETYRVWLGPSHVTVSPLCVLPRGHEGPHETSETHNAVKWEREAK